MFRDIVLILSGILGLFLFNFIRSKIIKKGTQILGTNIPLIDKVNKKFDASKLKSSLVDLTNGELWGKEFGFFNLRKFILWGGIALAVIGIVYGYGVWKGKQGIQPVLNLAGKEEWISINAHYLHIKKEGTLEVVDKDKKTVLKKISIKDLGNLRESLKPFGFILEPYFSFGGAVTNTGLKQDIGAGINLFKYYNWRMGSWLSNNGIYAGVDYHLTETFAVGAGFGKAYKSGDLLGVRGQWRF